MFFSFFLLLSRLRGRQRVAIEFFGMQVSLFFSGVPFKALFDLSRLGRLAAAESCRKNENRWRAMQLKARREVPNAAQEEGTENEQWGASIDQRLSLLSEEKHSFLSLCSSSLFSFSRSAPPLFLFPPFCASAHLNTVRFVAESMASLLRTCPQEAKTSDSFSTLALCVPSQLGALSQPSKKDCSFFAHSFPTPLSLLSPSITSHSLDDGGAIQYLGQREAGRTR